MSLALTLWQDWEQHLAKEGYQNLKTINALPRDVQETLLQKFEDSAPITPPNSAKARRQFRLYTVLIRRYLIYLTLIREQLDELYKALEKTALRHAPYTSWPFLKEEEAEEETQEQSQSLTLVPKLKALIIKVILAQQVVINTLHERETALLLKQQNMREKHLALRLALIMATLKGILSPALMPAPEVLHKFALNLSDVMKILLAGPIDSAMLEELHLPPDMLKDPAPPLMMGAARAAGLSLQDARAAVLALKPSFDCECAEEQQLCAEIAEVQNALAMTEQQQSLLQVEQLPVASILLQQLSAFAAQIPFPELEASAKAALAATQDPKNSPSTTPTPFSMTPLAGGNGGKRVRDDDEANESADQPAMKRSR